MGNSNWLEPQKIHCKNSEHIKVSTQTYINFFECETRYVVSVKGNFIRRKADQVVSRQLLFFCLVVPSPRFLKSCRETSLQSSFIKHKSWSYQFLPADLDVGSHDQIGFVVGFSFALAPGLPPLFHGQSSEHDCFRTPNACRPIGIGQACIWSMEQICHDGNTPTIKKNSRNLHSE